MSDLVERVARAIEQSMENARLFPAGNSPYEPEARVAIAIALEEAAKVALGKETDRVGIPCPDGIKGCAVFHFREVQRPRTPLEIAAAIRAMIPSGTTPAQNDPGNAE